MPDQSDAKRDILPIPDRPARGPGTYDAKDPDTSFPPIEPLRPPAGAPNVLVVLLDDVGFGASARSAGRCQTPTARAPGRERPASTPASTPPRCARRRAQALLTGRNHHAVGMGGITEIATSAPGLQLDAARTRRRRWPRRSSSTATPRRSSASATRCRCGRPARWARSTRWPTGGGGFEHFYGFIGGETNQYAPALYEDTVPVEPDRTPEEGYHFTEDMTDQAIDWVRQQKALMPDKPFFVYFAPGATHAPHHVPTEWSDKYKGQFDQGWDALREETFARQKELGVIPRRRRADRAARRDPGLGRHARRAQAGAGAPDGGLRRASWSTPTTTSAG